MIESIIILLSVLVPIGGLSLFLVIEDKNRKAAAARRKQIADQYNWCLANIRTDQRAQKDVLQAGRAYYGSGRKWGTPTVYDEIAISNDIKQAGGWF